MKKVLVLLFTLFAVNLTWADVTVSDAEETSTSGIYYCTVTDSEDGDDSE